MQVQPAFQRRLRRSGHCQSLRRWWAPECRRIHGADRDAARVAGMSDYDLLIWLIAIATVLFIIGEVQCIFTLRQTTKLYELTRKDDETDPGD